MMFDGRSYRLALVLLAATLVALTVPAATVMRAGPAGVPFAWGDNAAGQLGDQSTTQRLTPVQVKNLTNALGLAAGFSHSLAWTQTGSAFAWGNNGSGQLGNGSTTSSSIPVQVSGLTNVIGMAGGNVHSYALKSDGTVWAWGGNFFGQLGNGAAGTDSNVPVQVKGGAAGGTFLTGIVAIAAGVDQGLALRNDGTVWTWGGNFAGQLGNGATTDSSTPVQVSGLTGVVAVSSHGNHMLALKSNGTVFAWGLNDGGQLGNGNTTSSSTPVQVGSLSNVKAIAGAFAHSLALLNDGTMRAWGKNTDGQLGDGTTVSKSSPVTVSGLTNVVSIGGGYDHSLATLADGTVRAWGNNSNGQLGDNSTTNRSSPVTVSGLTTTNVVAGGNQHSLGLNAPQSATPTPTTTRTATATTAATATPTATAAVTATPTGTPAGGGTLGNLRFIAPVRVADTRGADVGGPIGFDLAGAPYPTGKVGANTIRRFKVAGLSFGSAAAGNAITFPANVTGILANITIVGGPAAGFVTVFSGDVTEANRPNASTVNPSASIAHNFWATAVGSNGAVGVYSSLDIDVVIDVVGYYAPGNPSLGNLRFITPVRVLDTRGAEFGGPIGFDAAGTPIPVGGFSAGQTRQFKLAGLQFGSGANQIQFPADISGIFAHVTVTGGQGGGFVTLLPGTFAGGVPTTSTLNPVANIAFNSWANGIGPDGTFKVFSSAAVDVIVDIVGFYAPSNPATTGNLTFITPLRALDTRPTGGGVTTTGFNGAGAPITAGQLPGGTTSLFTFAGKTFPGGQIPAGVKGILANVTTVGEPGGGFVTFYPGDAATPPNASTVNPVTSVAASFWPMGLPANGTGAIFTTRPLDVVVDIVGYFQ